MLHKLIPLGFLGALPPLTSAKDATEGIAGAATAVKDASNWGTRPVKGPKTTRTLNAQDVTPAAAPPESISLVSNLNAIRPANAPSTGKISSLHRQINLLTLLAFNRPAPTKVSPWDEDFPAPTCTYNQSIPCPIDWEYIRTHAKKYTKTPLTDKHIRAYELRAPWNPGERPTFNEILKELRETGDQGAVTSEEGIRKQFFKANQRVYDATGVYFENSPQGLDEFRIKKRDQPVTGEAATVRKRNKYRAGICLGHTVKVYLQPSEKERKLRCVECFQAEQPCKECSLAAEPDEKSTHGDDRCLECCMEGSCYDGACRMTDIDCCPKCCDPMEGMCLCPCRCNPQPLKPNHSRLRYLEHISRMGSPAGCPKHSPLPVRELTREHIEAVSYRDIEPEMILKVSEEIFDLYTSCFSPTIRHKFPERINFLEAWGKTDLIYADAAASPTLGDVLKVYCLSQAMDTPDVSDMVLDHIKNVIRDEEELIEQYRSGEFDMHDKTDASCRILDLEPEDFNYVWGNTTSDDPIRLLLLDIFSHKGDAARTRIEEEKEHWHPEFLMYRKMRDRKKIDDKLTALNARSDNLSQQVQLATMFDWDHAPLDQMYTEINAAEARCRELRPVLEILHPQIDLLKEKASNHLEEGGLIGRLVYRPRDDGMPHDDGVWHSHNACLFEGWLPKQSVFGNGWSDKDIEERLVQNDTVRCLSPKDDEAFCNTYHNNCSNGVGCCKAEPALDAEEEDEEGYDSEKEDEDEEMSDIDDYDEGDLWRFPWA